MAAHHLCLPFALSLIALDLPLGRTCGPPMAAVVTESEPMDPEPFLAPWQDIKACIPTLSDTTRKRKLLLKRLMGNDCKSVMCIFNTNTNRDEHVASPCSGVQARCGALRALWSLNHTTAFWTVVHLPGINLEVQRGKVTCTGSHSS